MKWTAVIFLVWCLMVEARSSDEVWKRDPLEASSWAKDDIHVILWRLYHAYEFSVGHPWGDIAKLINSAFLEEIISSNGGPMTIHFYRMKGKVLGALSQGHEVHLTIEVRNDSNTIMATNPSIVFEFRGDTTLRTLDRIFNDNSVVGRMVAMKSFRKATRDTRAVQEMEVTFQHLANHNTEWNCNGFAIRTMFDAKKGESGSVGCFVGSGLDPFTDWHGNERPMQFGPQEILIDPEWGCDCEEESSGAQVFIWTG